MATPFTSIPTPGAAPSPLSLVPSGNPAAATTPQPSLPVVPAPLPPLNPAEIASVGTMLSGKYKGYTYDRRLQELRWARNYRQVLGIYDPEIEAQLNGLRNKAYPKMTRVKCVSMVSRLMNLLFPSDDKNWSVGATAVPNLDDEDLQTVLDTLVPPPPMGAASPNMGAPGAPAPALPPVPSDDVIEQAIRKFAMARADAMGLVIEDQLEELGGDKMLDYVALVRKVLQSGVQYGVGILKGPYVEQQVLRTWEQDENGRLTATPYVGYRPRFEFVPVWDYYPDMAAKYLHQMDGQFQRMVMGRHELLMLKSRPDFLADQITKFVRDHPDGNYIRREWETEMRAYGSQQNVNQASKGKYEASVWTGFLSGKALAQCGVVLSDAQQTSDLKCEVWLLDDTVIKAQLDPWVELEVDNMRTYHHFIFEEDETNIMGNGLPNIMRDSQMGLCASVRMMMDNASIQRNIELNTKLLTLNQDQTSIVPDKFWYRDDEDMSTAQYPAIRVIDFPMHIPEMQSLAKMFEGFADMETFVNAATGGDMQKGPSEPFRTAAGASMLRGDAALPFKDVVRNFDCFTESVIGAILIFNKKFNNDPKTKGDFTPIARGATSLIAKEVQGIQLDGLVQTLSEEERKYVKWPELLRARVRTRDLQVDDVVMDPAGCDAVDAQTAQTQQTAATQAAQMAAAQLREILSQALKNISQAGKNSAASEADTANVVLKALEQGLTPQTLGIGNAPSTEPPQPDPGQDPGAAAGQTGAAPSGGPNIPQSLGAALSGTQADIGTAAGGLAQGTAAVPAG